MDVKTDFLNVKMDKEMFIKVPDGAEPGKADEVFRLNLGLYGTKQAGRLWGTKLDEELKAMGAVRSKAGPEVDKVEPDISAHYTRNNS